MGRGKNGRRRVSLDGPAPTAAEVYPQNFAPIRKVSPYGSDSSATSGLPPLVALDSAPPTNRQEVLDAIDFHWKNLSFELKEFLLDNPEELSLRRFVEYWTNPVRIENASPNIAASICGCSWYLALNYMSIGQYSEARALVLNGCFLQQCYNMPIEEIAQISRSVSGEHFRTRLPFFTDGLLAISSERRMSDFLRTKVSKDYQRRMSFATQTKQSKQKVRDYVDQISSDWNGRGSVKTSNSAGKQRRGRRVSLDSIPPDSFIEIKLVDAATGEETKMSYGASMPLKTLFKKYAEDRNLSLRELRFSYEGRTLFLSSAGNKSPQDLGIENSDCITVVNNAAPSASRSEEEKEESSGISSSDESKGSGASGRKAPLKGKKKRHRPRGRRASWSGHEIMGEEERFKLIHSRKLTKVFAEAAARFELIRRKLNELTLECTPPKVKSSSGRKKSPTRIPSLPLMHGLGEGTGGKAGVPFHAVHVGSPENLYTTQKEGKAVRGRKSDTIDLHGMAKEEALAKLDEELPKWVDCAMRGSYPFVMPVVIVCGCGNQVLSEAVEGWIKLNECVARAPKVRGSRRGTL